MWQRQWLAHFGNYIILITDHTNTGRHGQSSQPLSMVHKTGYRFFYIYIMASDYNGDDEVITEGTLIRDSKCCQCGG